MACSTKEIRKIIPFWFRLYTKIGFGSCGACITILLTTIHGYIEAPFLRY